jgi:hypothetical protein
MSDSLENLKAALKELSQENLQALLAEVIASGQGAVAIARDATGAKIVTGSDNIVGNNNSVMIHQGMDAESLKQVLQEVLNEKNISTEKFPINISESSHIYIGGNQTDPEIIKHIVREELRLPQTKYHQAVNLGLNALVELMQLPLVHTAVVVFRVDFEAACKQIDMIADHKDLHDLLHTLEFQCYNGIVQEASRFPDDETSLDILTDHLMTLQQLIRDIQKVVCRKTLATNEVTWFKKLEIAQENLENALEKLDTTPLQETIRLMRSVLAVQPSRINTELNVVARTLRLSSLVTALKSIWESLSNSNLDQEKFGQFQEGVKTLAELEQRLAALVIGHDYWQEIDLELRRIEGNIDQALDDLAISWPYLKKSTVILFDSNGDKWTIALQKDFQNLDDSLTKNNPAKIRRYFRLYRRRTSERFYEVDATLKRLCDELRKVDEPLTSLLRMMA